MDRPIDNPRWETYAQQRAAGKTQRQAMLVAYPQRVSWKPETVEREANKLEHDARVSHRLTALKERAANKVTITRAQVLSGMGETFVKGTESIHSDGISQVGVQAVSAIGRTLLDALPEEHEAASDVPPSDFALLIAPPFLPMHRHIADGTEDDFWLPGGRSSGKSSAVSLEIVDGIMHHDDRSALVVMKNGVDIRDSAWEQVHWAIDALGFSDAFDERPSLRRIVRKQTGQAIVFRGCDKPDKTKSIKAPTGTYFAYFWSEESDLFNGMGELRTVIQSVTRGAPRDAAFVRFHTFNPPRSLDSWANRETTARLDSGRPVYPSTYLDMPDEWIPDKTRGDAAQLKADDEQAYDHEWLGEAVGIGGEVFDRVEFRAVTDAEIASFERPMAGQDFGWWPDPWAMTLSDWQPGTRTLVSWREDGGNKLTPPQSAERAKVVLTWADAPDEKPYMHNILVQSDDAAPEQISAQRAEGVNARAAEKGNMRMASYRWLASVHWVIDPQRCPHLADEVRAKMHVQNRDGTWQEDIEDGDDHWIDATRYAVMPLVRRYRQAYRGTTQGA